MTEASDSSYAGDGIYREHILDHYKNPRNAGMLPDPTITHRELNPLCGDEITFSLKMSNGIVEAVRFLGKGCAISQASASMLSETLKGKSVQEIQNLQRADILELLGIPIGPVRTKCAMLSLVTLKKGIEQHEGGERK